MFLLAVHSTHQCGGSSLSFQSHFVHWWSLQLYETSISLHPKKAADVDDIGPRILQSSESVLVFPMHHLFSMSVSYHQIPAEWKLHSIVSVYN